jgi:hypothetical protein
METHSGKIGDQVDKENIANKTEGKESRHDTILKIHVTTATSTMPIGESIQRLSTSLTESTMALTSSIIPDFTALQSIGKSIGLSFAPLMANSVADFLPNFQKKINETFKGVFEGLGPILAQIDKRYWAILPYLKQAGFVLSPSSPLSLLTDIEELVENDSATPENVCKVLVDISELENYELLKEMVENWKKVPYFAHRSILLNDSLDVPV